MMIAQVLEAAMLICFGLSWPINAYKNYKAGTAAGTSWQFILLITAGYVAGIIAKFAADAVNWVLVVYFLNLFCLAINWGVYFRNRNLDKARLAAASAEKELASSVGSLLIATDGSRASLDAIGFAAHAIDLKKVHSIEILSVAETAAEASVSRAKSANESAAKLLGDLGAACTQKVLTGEAAQVIVKETHDCEANLVVMGSRGLSGLRELLLGSVSKAVTENVSCPVLVVK